MIYLDANAKARLRPEVIEEIGRFLGTDTWPANPSSVHSMGQRGRALLSDARKKILKALDVKDAELIFTSGGTESCN